MGVMDGGSRIGGQFDVLLWVRERIRSTVHAWRCSCVAKVTSRCYQAEEARWLFLLSIAWKSGDGGGLLCHFLTLENRSVKHRERENLSIKGRQKKPDFCRLK